MSPYGGRRDSGRRESGNYSDVDSVAETDNDTTNEESAERSLHETAGLLRSNSALDWPKKMKRRNLMLLSLASFIVSIGQSIILPNIEDISRDLNAGRAATAATLVNSPMLHFLTSLFPSED